MRDYADLEIGLHRRDRKGWTVELRFNNPESDADERSEAGSPCTCALTLMHCSSCATTPTPTGGS
jgi:hypothetical protein